MKILLTAFVFFVCFAASAQTKVVWGYLRDSITNEPIGLASVKNMNSNKTVITSATGLFSIELSEKQVLTFAAVGYHLDTIHYEYKHLLQDTLLLVLAPLSYNLGNVTVIANGMSRYQRDSAERRKDFLQDIVSYKIPAVSQANSGAGIALNIDRFSKHETRKRKAWAFFESTEREAYIDYRFPASLVNKYTGLKDEKLQHFMQLYRPSFEWLRSHLSEEDIEYYLNDKLKAMKQSGSF